MIRLGQKFPEFKKKATVSIKPGKEFSEITNKEHIAEKKWLVMFWYPKDFTFVCPTEIIEFNRMRAEFEKRNATLVGASTDSEFSHLGWRVSHPDLKNIEIPLLADTSKSLAEALGILQEEEKIAYRATFIVDPDGIVRWINVNDLAVGRNIDEVLRVLDGLQNGGLIPCNWKKGEKTLSN